MDDVRHSGAGAPGMPSVPPGSGPALQGLTVVVTRTAEQSAGLARELESLGASVLLMPVIRLDEPEDWAPVDAALSDLEPYGWVVFTSANAVERFLGRLDTLGCARSALAARRIAAVGPATAARLEAEGLTPDLVPEEAVAESLVESFERHGIGPGERVLFPRALEAREVLPDALGARGVLVDVVTVYRTVPAVPDPVAVRRIASGDADIVTFTSPSTVRGFFGMLEGTPAEDPARRLLIATIGPVTSDAVRALGLTPAVEAGEHTAAGLGAALSRHVGGRP